MTEFNHEGDKTQSFILLTKGTTVGHYEILEKIGSGGMGEVYLAKDIKLNRKVALKFLPVQFCEDENYRVRFFREAQATAKLNHPNIITIYEVSEYKSRPFFAMEYLKGKSLHDFIRNRKIPWQEVINIAIQIAEGLEEAHRRGIIHRDIKPSNFILDDKGRVKILDFGLATIKGQDKLTKTGSTLGTLHYMSPEQTRGETLDERSDIFSFGTVFYEMITGQNPFQGENDPAIMYAIVYEKPEPLARFKSGVTTELQEIISKMLVKDKLHRYKCVEDMLVDLRHLRETFYRPGKITCISLLRKKSITLFALCLIILVGISWLSYHILTNDKTPDEYSGRIPIGVMSIENLTGDPELNWLKRGVPELLTTSLALSPELYVLDNQRFYDILYSMGIKDIDSFKVSQWGEVAQQAKLKMVITGSIFKFTDKFRLQIKLIERTSDELIKTEYVDGHSTEDLMSMIDSIAYKVRLALEIESLGQTIEESSVRRVTTSSIEAYRHFVDGAGYFIRYDWNGAIPFYEKAVEKDSGFVLAWLCLTGCYFNSGDYEHAGELFVYLKKLRDNAPLMEQLMIDQFDLLMQGDIPGHIKVIEKIIHYNPETNFWKFMKGQAYRNLSKYDSAITIFENLVSKQYRWPGTYSQLSALYLAKGNKDKAIKTFKHALEADPEMLLAYAMLGGFAELKGSKAEAEKYYIQLMSRARVRNIDPASELCQIARRSYELGYLALDLYYITTLLGRRAVQLDSSAYDGLYWEGMSYARLDDTVHSVEILTDYIDKSMDSSRVRQAILTVQKLSVSPK